MEAEGRCCSKARLDRSGNAKGGVPIARGALYLMLQNRIYCGEIVHKDKAYPGLHDQIIDQELWDEVQSALAENRVERVNRAKAVNPSMLAGLVYDHSGERMSPTHANKTRRGVGGAAAPNQKCTRYRYYVSQSLIKRGRPTASDAACRVPAADLENIVEDRICALLKDDEAIFDAAGATSITARKMMIENAANLARRWPALSASNKRAILHALVGRVDVRPEAVDIAIRPAVLSILVKNDLDLKRLPASPDGTTLVLSVPARLRRMGMETKFLIQGTLGAEPPRRTDRSLLRLVGHAQHFNDLVMQNNGRSMQDLAAEAGVSPSYFTRVLRLSFLAPEITKAILQGRLHRSSKQPAGTLQWNPNKFDQKERR